MVCVKSATNKEIDIVEWYKVSVRKYLGPQQTGFDKLEYSDKRIEFIWHTELLRAMQSYQVTTSHQRIKKMNDNKIFKI